MKLRLFSGMLLLAATTISCAGPGDANESADQSDAVPDVVTSTEAHAHPPAEGEGLALLPIMQQLGADMLALTQALMTEDHATVAARAGAIAEHHPISADEVTRIQRTLGDAMQRFEELDMAVHNSAVALHEAAESRDVDAVITRLSEVQRGCVACHEMFRERLRENLP